MFAREGEKRPSMIVTTAKIAAVVLGLSWFAANWVAATTDRHTLAQLAGRVSRGEEPLTTGSIGPRAATTKIDPCVAPKR